MDQFKIWMDVGLYDMPALLDCQPAHAYVARIAVAIPSSTGSTTPVTITRPGGMMSGGDW